MTGPYEQIEDDLGYLQLGRAAECFTTLAEQAGREGWSHVEYLSRVIAEQTSATTNRRLAARLRYACFLYRRSVEDFDFDFQPRSAATTSRMRYISRRRSRRGRGDAPTPPAWTGPTGQRYTTMTAPRPWP